MRPSTLLAAAVLLVLVACGGRADGPSPALTDPPLEEVGTPSPGGPREATEPGEATGPTEDTEPGEDQAAGDLHDLRVVGPAGEEAAFRVEVVADPVSRQQGLMHRTELDPDAGMLFLFPAESTGGFWMKDTLIPLSIAFIGPDGEILAILDMEPCEADPCPSYTPGVAYTAALEVNQGAFADAGVVTGWRVELGEHLPAPS